MKLLVTMLLCAGLMQAGAQEDMIMKNLKDFAEAVLKKDKAVLSKLMADSVLYSHSNAKVETKAEAIKAFEDATYKKFEYGPQKIQFYGNTAVVRGDVEIINPATQPGPLKLNILQVWVKQGKDWQMVARQSTRLPQ
jgi:ketosteroid isomerase-like protein